jgi:hypothetical protein
MPAPEMPVAPIPEPTSETLEALKPRKQGKKRRRPILVAEPEPAPAPFDMASLAGLSPQEAMAKLEEHVQKTRPAQEKDDKPRLEALKGPTTVPYQMPPQASPAPLAKVPAAVKVHWTQLYPNIARIDPQTGQPRQTRQRRGGQFSARRLTVVNIFDPKDIRFVVVPIHMDASNWPLAHHQRLSDPSVYPEDRSQGNIEVIFDFEDELADFMRAFGIEPRIDPLKKNDVAGGSAFEMQGGGQAFGQVASVAPPGGFPVNPNPFR